MRRRVFVGRQKELERFRRFLETPKYRLLHIQGPGGVGKTFLLNELSRIARRKGARTALLDGHWIQPSPGAVRTALDEHEWQTDLLFIDTFERLAALEGWFRDVLFPELPDRTRVVTAGRAALSDAWLIDPAWSELAEHVSLRNLPRKDSLTYLARRGVSATSGAEIAEATHGHPLSLAVAADLAGSARGSLGSRGGADRRLRAVLRRSLAEAPTELHRKALFAAALARTATEPLLRALLDLEDASEFMDWVRERSFVQPTPDGLLLHDLVRETFFRELRTRDPDLLNSLLDRAVPHAIDRLGRGRGGGREERLILDACFLVRHEPAAHMLRFGDPGELYLDDLREDRARVAEVVRLHEGRASAEAAAYWLDRAPDSWAAIRDADQVMRGFASFLDVKDIGEEEAARDPLVATFLEALREHQEPLRSGERARLCRFWMSVKDHQRASAVQTFLFAHMTVQLGFLPRVAIGAAVHVPAGHWAARADMTHELMCRLEMDGVDFGVFGHDWRKESSLQSLERLLQLLRRVPGVVKAPAEEPQMVLLDRGAFARAARRALKDFHHAARLAENPLAFAPLVLRDGVAPGTREAVERLRGVLRETCASVGGSGDATLARVLEQTFLRSSPKQLAAAEALGMSFSTYRRRLSTATDLAIESLWKLETTATSIRSRARGPGDDRP